MIKKIYATKHRKEPDVEVGKETGVGIDVVKVLGETTLECDLHW